MKKLLYFVFAMSAIICSLLLAFVSLSSIYLGNKEALPGLLYMFSETEEGIVDAYISCFDSAVDMPKDASMESFFAVIFTWLLKIIVSPIHFLSVVFAPILLLLCLIFVLVDWIKRATDYRESNNAIRLATIFAVSSQCYHLIYSLLGLHLMNRSAIYNLALPILFISLFALSHMQKGHSYEVKATLVNNVAKLASLGIALYSLFALLPLIPETRIIRILYSAAIIELSILSLSSSIFPKGRSGIAQLTANLLCIQMFFMILSAFHGKFNPTSILIIASSVLLLVVLSEFYAYYYNLLSVKYDSLYISEVMSGIWDNKQEKPSSNYRTGIPFEALKYNFKILIGSVVYVVTLIATVYISRFVQITLFAIEEPICNLITVLLLLIVSIILMATSNGSVWDPTNYVYSYWTHKNSSLCKLVSAPACVLVLIIASGAIALIKAPWSPLETGAEWNYIFSSAILFMIVIIYNLFNTTSSCSCSCCGYINTSQAVSQTKSKYLKKHIRKVEGYYTYDSSTSTTNHHTSADTTTEHYLYGDFAGRSYGTTNYNTTDTTTTTTKKWVPGYEIDEGLHEHTVTNTTYRCDCCGYEFRSSSDTSKLVG